jgi:hypothetical protein
MQHLPRGCIENFQLVRNDQRIWTYEVQSEMHVIQENVGLKGLCVPVETEVAGGIRKLVDHRSIQKEGYYRKFKQV